jgi:hypothetical protein
MHEFLRVQCRTCGGEDSEPGRSNAWSDIIVGNIEDGNSERQAHRCKGERVKTGELGSADALEKANQAKITDRPGNEGDTQPKCQQSKDAAEATYPEQAPSGSNNRGGE